MSTNWLDSAVASGKGSAFQGCLDSMSSHNTKLEQAKWELSQCKAIPQNLFSGWPPIWTPSSVNCPCPSAIKWLNHVTLLYSLQWPLWARINLQNGIKVQNCLADENDFWVIPVQRNLLLAILFFIWEKNKQKS